MAKTAILADDVTYVRDTLKQILQSAGIVVVGEAKDGEQAVALYEKLKPDLVLLDVVMPKMTGIDAARYILKMDAFAKVIMVSAMNQESLVMEAIHVGASDYLLKPISVEDVTRAVGRVFDGPERKKQSPFARSAAK